MTMMSFPPMPLLSISSPKTIEKCKSLSLLPSDVFICSYPKSGTTWTQQIVLSLLLVNNRLQKEKRDDGNNKNEHEDIIEYDHVSDFAPFYEIDAHWEESNSDSLDESVIHNHQRLGQRVFNTHLRWNMLPKCSSDTMKKDKKVQQQQQLQRPSCGKFIYVTRNLPDVCISFYHHLSNQKEGTYTNGFEQFARDWMEGNIPFGSPLHHLLSFAEGFCDNEYCASTDDDNKHHGQPLLLLSYEKMKINLRNEVLRIIDHLNLKHIPMDVLDNEILPTFGFQYMKENSNKFQPKSVTWLNDYQFLRKGVIGDGKKMMTDTKCEDDENVSLMALFNDWVKREGYCLKIDELTGCGLEREIAEQFKALVSS